MHYYTHTHTQGGYMDDRDLNVLLQRFCPGVTDLTQSVLKDQYVQTAVISVRWSTEYLCVDINDINTGWQPADRYGHVP